MPNKVKRIDPSRTTLLRKSFMMEIWRRVRSFTSELKTLLILEDAFGLKPKVLGVKLNAVGKYQFLTDSEKLKEFNKWIDERIDSGVLGIEEDNWSNKYVSSAYKKGIMRAYIDTHKKDRIQDGSYWMGGRDQFLKEAFAASVTIESVKLIYTRTYDRLNGFTKEMGSQLSRIMADGLSNGWTANKIANEMVKSIEGITKRRALTIANTEIIHAHSEGQLDGFERIGKNFVQIQAEWLTAGDSRVCAQCEEMEGDVMPISEARGLIPLHPNCRCCWLPYEKSIVEVD